MGVTGVCSCCPTAMLRSIESTRRWWKATRSPTCQLHGHAHAALRRSTPRRSICHRTDRLVDCGRARRSPLSRLLRKHTPFGLRVPVPSASVTTGFVCLLRYSVQDSRRIPCLARILALSLLTNGRFAEAQFGWQLSGRGRSATRAIDPLQPVDQLEPVAASSRITDIGAGRIVWIVIAGTSGAAHMSAMHLVCEIVG